MKIFSELKGVPAASQDDEINNLLTNVQLENVCVGLRLPIVKMQTHNRFLQVADHRVSTYSGGMKRRLTVAITFLGDPKIVFLGQCLSVSVYWRGGKHPDFRIVYGALLLEMHQNS